ncbi:MAG TPA: hypothetical protein VGE72_20075, partial [Azospirillum sp.]
DAVCIDLVPWRATGAAEPAADVLEDALRRRNGAPFLVGASAAGGTRAAVEALLAMGADFAAVGSAFLMAQEANVAPSLRRALARGAATPRLLPDWTCPELASRTWSLCDGDPIAVAVEELQGLYTRPGLCGADLAALVQERAEPGALLGAEAVAACIPLSGPALRARLRALVPDAVRGRIVPCDGSLRGLDARAPLPAARIAEALRPT